MKPWNGYKLAELEMMKARKWNERQDTLATVLFFVLSAICMFLMLAM